MLLGLLVQTSLLVAPLQLGETPPECRAARTIVVAPARAGAPASEAELAKAAEIVERLKRGEDFEALVKAYSSGPTADFGGVMGTFMPGILAPELDRFLFQAAVGEISGPLASPAGLVILQRIEKDAGCRALLVQGKGAEARAKAEKLLAELRGGADFAALAREHSADAASAARGGAYRIFERGPNDQLLKAAVFALEPGAIGGPLETPLGFFLYQRVAPTELDPALAEVELARARAILVSWKGARGAAPEIERTQEEALALARSLAERIRKGEDMAALAREHDDDRGGRERSGDLGWVRRRSPQVPGFMDELFTAPAGACVGPLGSTAGWVLVRRER